MTSSLVIQWLISHLWLGCLPWHQDQDQALEKSEIFRQSYSGPGCIELPVIAPNSSRTETGRPVFYVLYMG